MNLIHRCKVERAVTTTGTLKKTEWESIYAAVPCLFYPLSERERMAGKAIEWEMHCLCRQFDIAEGDRLTRTDTKTSQVWTVKRAILVEGINLDLEGDQNHLHLLLGTYR
jgi:hypothetical protein